MNAIHDVRDGALRFTYGGHDGTLATVWDNRHPASVFDPDGGRWTVYCEQHGGLVNAETIAVAKYLARHTGEFCEVCSGVDPHAYDGGGLIPACTYD